MRTVLSKVETMVGNISFSSIIDAAFFGLVIYTCYRSLFRAPVTDGGAARAKRWKDELRNVEESLRELIGEASAAGSNLNRSLLKRKEELQKLIGQIEEARLTGEELLEEQSAPRAREARPIASPARSSAQPALPAARTALPSSRPSASQVETRRRMAAAAALQEAADLPNESWSRAPSEASDADAFELGLEELIDSTPDRITLSNAPARRAPQPPRMDANSRARSLAAQIEKLKTKPLDPEEEILPPPPPGVDPIAFKVARRLLAQGREIHVVARKIELPVAEVRMIERMMRIEQGEDIDSYETDEAPEEAPEKRSPAGAKFERSSSLL